MLIDQLGSYVVNNLKVIHLIVAHSSSSSLLSLWVVLKEIVGDEFDWVLRSLLGALGQGLE